MNQASPMAGGMSHGPGVAVGTQGAPLRAAAAPILLRRMPFLKLESGLDVGLRAGRNRCDHCWIVRRPSRRAHSQALAAGAIGSAPCAHASNPWIFGTIVSTAAHSPTRCRIASATARNRRHVARTTCGHHVRARDSRGRAPRASRFFSCFYRALLTHYTLSGERVHHTHKHYSPTRG